MYEAGRMALARMPAGDRVGIVSFGRQATVERFPSDARTLDPLAATPGEERTNIADAIQLALGLLPATGQRRLVLLSDGGANAGDTEAAARMAAAGGVALEIVPLSGTSTGPDVQISAVTLPPAVRAGARPQLSVQTEATATTTANLIVSDNGRPVLSRQINVPAGADRVIVDLPEPDAAFNRYEVRLTAAGDAHPENDSAETFSEVHGRPNILCVEGSPGAARNLHDALVAAAFDVRTVAPDQLPTSMAALSAFDAVVLVDVPMRDLPLPAVALLPGYVRNLGRGLAMIGGPHTFGAGGYRGSPIEDLLPVTMDLPPQVQNPAVAVVVVIDISGSMTVSEDGVAKMQLAAEGAARVAAQLRDDDEITVIPFDHAPKGIIGPRSGRDRAEIARLLDQIPYGGSGITMHDALAEAARYLRASTKSVRHLITITDGNDTAQHEGSLDIVSQLSGEQVTVSTVAMGDGTDISFLKDVARVGGGRFFLTEHAANLPSILFDEIQIMLRPYLVEGAFTPRQDATSRSSMLEGIGPFPQLRGYVASTPKRTAEVLLWTPQDDPLLAVWHAGLGRSLAWASDLNGRWAGALVRAPAFPTMMARMIDWLLPPPGSQNLTLATELGGDRLRLTAHAQDERGQPVRGLQVAGMLEAADGAVRPVTLREVMPGSYTVEVGDAPAGTYQVRVVASRADGQPFGVSSGGVVIPQGSEYRGDGGDQQLLASLAQITGGRMNPAPAAVYDPTGSSLSTTRDATWFLLWLALALLPLEVGVRKLAFRRPIARR